MPSNQRCQNLSNPIFVVLFVIFYVAAVVCLRVSERRSAMAQIQFTQGAYIWNIWAIKNCAHTHAPAQGRE